jgi:hypothetical protein
VISAFKKMIMKKYSTILLLVFFSLQITAQKASVANYEIQSFQSASDRANKKKRTATILLVTGSAIAVVGAAFMISGLADGGSFDAFNDDDFESNDARFMGGWTAVHVGGGLALTSIPFFRKSRQLRNSAMLQFNRDLVPFYAVGGKVNRVPQLRVGISFPLGK